MKPDSPSALARLARPESPSSTGLPPAAGVPDAPGARSLSVRLVALARRVEAAAWNRAGTDKTWVVETLAQRGRFEREIRPATPVPHAAGR